MTLKNKKGDRTVKFIFRGMISRKITRQKNIRKDDTEK